MIETGALLFAAAVVGILHMSAPDHWVTLVILGRVERWHRSKLLAVSVVTGVGHVVLSIVLGLVIVVLGLVLSTVASYYFTEAVGVIMVLTGLYVGVKALIKREDQVSDEVETVKKEKKMLKKGAGYFAVLGAALSPDLSILPIFLIAVPAGLSLAFYTALVFAVASLLTILLLVFVGSMGLAKTLERLPAKYNDALVGFVIAVVGVYILLLG